MILKPVKMCRYTDKNLFKGLWLFVKGIDLKPMGGWVSIDVKQSYILVGRSRKRFPKTFANACRQLTRLKFDQMHQPTVDTYHAIVFVYFDVDIQRLTWISYKGST